MPSGLPYVHSCSDCAGFLACCGGGIAARLGSGGQQRQDAGEMMAVVQAISCRRDAIILHLKGLLFPLE